MHRQLQQPKDKANIPLISLFKPPYDDMPVIELASTILYRLSSDDYNALEGITSIGKARNLKRMFRTGSPHTKCLNLPDYFRRNLAP